MLVLFGCLRLADGEEERGGGDAPTRRGSQFAKRAQERMMRRKPAARTKERRMTATADNIFLSAFYSVFSKVNEHTFEAGGHV